MHNHQRHSYSDNKGVPKETLRTVNSEQRKTLVKLQTRKVRQGAGRLEEKLTRDRERQC